MTEKTNIRTVHVLAECRSCDKIWDDYRTAVTQARNHADATGHAVRVERAQCWTYNSSRREK